MKLILTITLTIFAMSNLFSQENIEAIKAKEVLISKKQLNELMAKNIRWSIGGGQLPASNDELLRSFKDCPELNLGETLRIDYKLGEKDKLNFVLNIGSYTFHIGENRNKITKDNPNKEVCNSYRSPMENLKKKQTWLIKYTKKGFDLRTTLQEGGRLYGFSWPLNISEKSLPIKISLVDANTPSLIDYIAIGKSDFPREFQPTPRWINFVKYNKNAERSMSTLMPKDRVKVDFKTLSLDGPLTASEWEYVKYSALVTQIRYFSYFIAWQKVYHLPWVYKRLKERAVLDHIISLSDIKTKGRSDMDPLKSIHMAGRTEDGFYAREKVPVWRIGSNGWYGKENKLLIFRRPSAAHFSGISYGASAAKMISENPEVWAEIFKGETERYYLDHDFRYKGLSYRKVALKIIDDHLPILEFLMNRYLRNDKNRVSATPFNLYASALVGFTYFSQAMNNLKVYPKLAKELEETVKLHRDFWRSCHLRVPNKKGMTAAWYPYHSTTKHDDLPHATVTLGAYQFLAYEGIMSDEDMQLMANHLRGSYNPEKKHFANRRKGPRSLKSGAGWGLLPLAEWHKEIYDLAAPIGPKGLALGLLRAKDNRAQRKLTKDGFIPELEHLVKTADFVKDGKLLTWAKIEASKSNEFPYRKGKTVPINKRKTAWPRKAKYALDGIFGSYWQSNPGEKSQWLSFELSQPKEVSQIKIFWNDDYAKSFKIKVGESEESSEVISEISNNGSQQSNIKLSKRLKNIKYIAIIECQPQDGKETVGIQEIKVNGKFIVPAKAFDKTEEKK